MRARGSPIVTKQLTRVIFFLADFGLATPLTKTNSARLGTAKVMYSHEQSIKEWYIDDCFDSSGWRLRSLQKNHIQKMLTCGH